MRTKPNTMMNISAYSMQGKRNHMEDFFDIGYQLKENLEPGTWPYEYFYFGIFDGHGGCEAARFAKENLLRFITKQADFWSKDDNRIMRAIHTGFAHTHAAMKKEMSSWSRTNRILPSTAGTTASVLFIRNGKYYTGHVGDSRIVISREHPETKHWISYQVTEDHKPESTSETERIERAGGEVKCKIGVHRVVWKRPVLNNDFDAILNADPKPDDYDTYLDQVSSYPVAENLVNNYQTIPFLAIARSLGDFWSYNPYSGQYVVSPEPDVLCRPVDRNDRCILLATDGLWNVMSSTQAVRFLQELNVKSRKRDKTSRTRQYFATDNFYDVNVSKEDKNHALSLVYIAYQIWERRRLRSDNITAVVAMLSDILAPLAKKSHHIDVENQNLIENGINPFTHNYIDTNTKQIEQTSLFSEKILLDQVPSFKSLVDDVTKDWLHNIEDYLVFPPTVFENHSDFVEPPENYMRLSKAESRKLQRPDFLTTDSFIYIKKVSDDPEDDTLLPARLNHKNKEVRDSSSQATQPIHDFGQSWNELENIVEDDHENEDEKSVLHVDHDNEVVCNPDKLEDETKSNDHIVKEANPFLKGTWLEHFDEMIFKDPPDSPITKLRCLMNRNDDSPKATRRFTRSEAFLSASDNSKRKLQLTGSAEPKKRRQSCAFTQS